jgi:hypothetical protein
LTNQDPKPWYRQPDETEMAFDRYRRYLALGPGRSLDQLVEALTAAGMPASLARLRQLAKRHRWDERATAYDKRPAERLRLDPQLDPWERQPGESDRMYSRFAAYLELGRTRTLTTAAEILTSTGDETKLHGAYIRELSARFRWVERVGAYDREQDRLERERLVEQRRDMIRRHRQWANDLSAKAKGALANLKTEKITPLDIVRMLRLAAGIEATALGMPFETVAVTGPAGAPLLVDDLAAYTADERRQRMADVGREIVQRAAAPVDDMSTEDE